MSQPVQGEPDYPSIKDEAIDVAVERCARIALDEKVDAAATGSIEDEAYNRACDDIAAAIRNSNRP